MASIFIRIILTGGHKLSELASKLSESEIFKQILIKWNDATCFINYTEDMLDTINNELYHDVCTHQAKTFSTDLVNTSREDLRKFLDNVTYSFSISESYNLLGNQVYDTVKFYKRMKTPFGFFNDDDDKLKQFYLCIPGAYNYTTQHLITNTLQKNFYAKKMNMYNQNLKQEMHNCLSKASPLLKCHYITRSVEDGKKKSTVTFINSNNFKNIVREVTQTLLENPIITTRKRHRSTFVEEPLQLLTLILNRNPQTAENIQKLLIQNQLKLSTTTSTRHFHQHTHDMLDVIRKLKFDKSKSAFECNLCERIDHEDVKERTSILEINQKVFEDKEKEIAVIQIIDKDSKEKSENFNNGQQFSSPNTEASLTQIHLHNEPPHYLQNTLWNVSSDKLCGVMTKLKKYKYELEEIQSSFGRNTKVTHLIAIDN